MTLTGRTVILRSFSESDYNAIYAMLGRTFTYRNLGKTVPPDQLASFIWGNAFTLMTIAFKESPAGCLGMVAIRDADLANGLGYFDILIDSENAPDSAGGEAIVLFLRHVFNTTPLRKIYAQSTQASLPWLADTKTPVRSMRLEGVMRGHLLIGGQPKDVYQFAFWRGEFLRETDNLAAFLARGDEERVYRPGRSVGFQEFINDLVARFSFLPFNTDVDGGLDLVNDLHIDSMLLIEALEWMEDRYKCVLPDDELVHVTNLHQLHALLETRPVQ